MNCIDTLHINNFKFFQESKPIKLGGNHLLLYGENGSGKSSIYWALYTLFEATLKQDDSQVKKYFSKLIKPKDSLVNIHAPIVIPYEDDYNSFIEVKTDDRAPITYKISVSEAALRESEGAKMVNYASDYINYGLLSSFFGFWHSDDINLFEIFSEDILKYVKFRPVSISRFDIDDLETTLREFRYTNAYDIWKQIEQGPQTVKNILTNKFELSDSAYDEFKVLVNSFNEDLRDLVSYINLHGPAFLEKLGYSFSYFLDLENGGVDFNFVRNRYRYFKFILRLNIPVYEDVENELHKPHSFLNEAKKSAIAISIRLAILSKKLNDPTLNCLKFIVLDDLLISLDMRNREKVLDLMLSNEFSNNFQLLILTHDSMFYKMAKQKIKYLGQEKWVYYEMFEDVVNGLRKPHIRSDESYIEKARNQFYIYKQHEASGNYMRKEAEAFCNNFLPKHLLIDRKTFAELNLSGKLIACGKFAKDNGISTALFEKLDSHRKFIFNALSHDSYDVPLFKSELELSFDTFSDLYKMKFKTAFLPETNLFFELSDGTDVWRYDIELYNETKLIKEPATGSILTSGMINFYVYKITDRKPKNPQHKLQSIKSMYDYAYNKSDKAKSADFWDEVLIRETGLPLKSIRTF